MKPIFLDLDDETLNHLTRGEWIKGTEEKLYDRFFRDYRLDAIRITDRQLHDVYHGVYVPFILRDSKYHNMKVRHLFNTLPDAFILYYSKRRVEYLQNHYGEIMWINRQINMFKSYKVAKMKINHEIE